MKTRLLGSIEVSEIGMGCMGFSHGYGQIPPKADSIAAIRAGFDAGCTFFDTAEAYGPSLLPENRGHNEHLLGKAVADFRDDVVLATKLHLPTEEARADGVEATLRHHLVSSLQRLHTDRVELYYLHRVNPDIPVEDVAAGMGTLISEGLIRGWGLSQVPVSILARAHAVTPVSAVQNIYSMVERDVEKEVIPWCREHDVGLVAFSPIVSGLLSGQVSTATQFEKVDDVRNVVPQLSAENRAANQPLVDLLASVAAAKGATSAQVSLAWMLHKYPHVVPIPGSKHPGRIVENLAASEVSFSAEEFAQLEPALDAIKVHGHRGFDESDGRSFLNRDQ
ncbi:aldo/keto reductase [Actinomyces sp. MRS3W]|uniref:aldo/keto reductase n=1 Tax=Actinomyces sp. MRS3W TaxID=2800796 RepID=UPI0028FD3FE1|nr:aldo/keto reductase [Actinomyces sp. MRS3W]MDU0347695.1 aldo/keto reductase [Actinomyces sp. MRS3W]